MEVNNLLNGQETFKCNAYDYMLIPLKCIWMSMSTKACQLMSKKLVIITILTKYGDDGRPLKGDNDVDSDGE